MGANCAASTSIGILFCCKGCSAEKLRNTFTFVPPPPSYTVQVNPEDTSKERVAYTVEALADSEIYRRAAECAEVHWVTTSFGQRIPLVWLKTTSLSEDGAAAGGAPVAEPAAERLILLHCHGNAADVGLMMGPYFELAKVLGIEVVGVEYTGYGASTGSPSAGATHADIEAAYDFLIKAGVAPERIVVYGQSVGTGPASSLAARRAVRGLVLHSAMLSGIKVIDPMPDKSCRPSCVWKCFDFYPNDRHVKLLRSPALVIHGQQDDIVPFYHGHRLHKAIPKEYRWPPYFPQNGGHNDLVEMDMHTYFGNLTAFVRSLRDGSAEAALNASAAAANVPVQIAMQGAPLKLPKATAQTGPGAVQSPHTGDEGLSSPLCAGDVELSEQPSTSDLPDGEHLHAPEPRVGPDDGRYDKLRRGHLAAAA